MRSAVRTAAPGASGPDVQRQRGIVQQAVELAPALVLIQNPRWLLAGDGRDGQLRQEAALGGPAQEVADGVVARVAGREPLVEAVLGEVTEREFVLIEPGQQFEGDADPGSDVGASHGWASPAGGPAAGPFEQEPVDKRADEGGVLGGLVGQELVQPGGDPIEVLVTFGQYAGMDQGLADVVLVAAGRKFVQKVVAERLAAGGEFAEQSRVRASPQPAQDAAGASAAANAACSGRS